MTFIKPEELGLYAPKTNEKINLSSQAAKYLNEAIFTYKQLFYGLRVVAWKYRDKRATFYDALTNGELDQFKVAPGHRAPDGSYTKDEWDYDRLNSYMWNRFRERFDASFNLEYISEIKTFKDIQTAINELLEIALANWGESLLANDWEEPEPIESIGKGVTRCEIQYRDIKIQGQFGSQERTITLSKKGIPQVVINQTKDETSWKGGISFEPWGQPMSLNSKNAAAFGEMLELASRLNLDINQFMANPEEFLGIESDQAHQRNLQRMKQRLLQINRDNYERRKAEADNKPTRRLNETVDGTEDNTTEEVSKPTVNVKERQRQRQQEAEQWLQNNPEFLEDVDALVGVSNIDI